MIRHDWKRAFGIQFYISVVVSVLVMFMFMITQKMQEQSVFEIVEMNMYSIEFTLVIAMATVPYAHAFIEDFERKTIYQIVTRTDFRRYIISKTATIFLSAVMTVTASTILYVCLLRVSGHAWMSDCLLQSYEINGIGFPDLELWWLLESHKEMLFYLMAGLQMGLLAGLVTLVASLLSLYIRNRMMIIVFPVICLYMMFRYLSGIMGYGYGIYQLYSVFQNYSFAGSYFTLRACITTFFAYMAVTALIYHKVKRMIQYD